MLGKGRKAQKHQGHGLRKGTAFESLSTSSLFENFPLFSLFSKKHHRWASRFGLAFSLSLEFFQGSIVQRRVQPLQLSNVPP